MADLTIKNWELGVGESPYTGFAQMVNVDIYSKPGSLKISNRLERDPDSVNVVDELIKWDVQDPRTGDNYMVDRNGKLYKRDRGTGAYTVITGHSNTNANGEGLAIWKDYLFYARRTRIDVYGPLSGAPTWDNNFRDNSGNIINLESSAFYNLHPMLSSSQRSVLYIGNANYVDTLEQVAGQTFDPGNQGTYVYNSQDLELGSEFRITCLEESGSNIAIGTQMGSNRGNVADTFFWDGISDFVTGGSTIYFAENGVKMMKNVNNILYTIAGEGVPRLFNSVTSQAQEAKRLNNIDLPIDRHMTLFPDAIDQQDGEIVFGIGNSTGGAVGPMGVYSLRSAAYVTRYLISTGNDGSLGDVAIGSIKSLDADRLLVSWSDDNDADNFGVDILTPNFYENYTAYAESPIYTVGTEDDPKTYEKVQVIMGKKLKSGDGVKIFGRKSLDDTYVLLATFDSSNYLGKSTFDVKVSNLWKVVDFQIKVQLTTAQTSTVSPELQSITFK